MGEESGLIVRAAAEQDLAAIALIQSLAPEASQWNPRDYLVFETRVAVRDGSVKGFIVARRVVDSEWEILNLAVAPEARRQGIGRQLLGEILSTGRGSFYLEVRESNTAARQFYERAGFMVVTKRLRYYSNPEETAIVMNFHS